MCFQLFGIELRGRVFIIKFLTFQRMSAGLSLFMFMKTPHAIAFDLFFVPFTLNLR